MKTRSLMPDQIIPTAFTLRDLFPQSKLSLVDMGVDGFSADGDLIFAASIPLKVRGGLLAGAQYLVWTECEDEFRLELTGDAYQIEIS